MCEGIAIEIVSVFHRWDEKSFNLCVHSHICHSAVVCQLNPLANRL